MKEKLKPNKKYEDFLKAIEENRVLMNKEIDKALEKTHKENPNLGIGGYRNIEEPITKKYYEKHIEICKEYFEEEEKMKKNKC